MAKNNQHMVNKLCLITGATDGIGLATAEQLAKQGAKLILVGRKPIKTAITVEHIQHLTGNPHIQGMVVDLSSQAEIRQLAQDICAQHNHLDVLINNAGAMFPTRQESLDGIEMTFALNHLAYFLLTNLLTKPLKQAPQGRVINVASQMQSAINFTDVQNTQEYHGWSVYAQSKFANIAFTYELARRLSETNVTVNALHPGAVRTNLFNGGRTPAEGAKTSVYLATSPRVKSITGGYFVDSKPAKTIPASYDCETTRRLWAVSEQLVGMPMAVNS